MKKILLLITILCCISIFTVSAQNYVVHRQRDNVPTTKEHLSFEGIPINGNQRDFFNSLKKKGYEVLTKGVPEGEYYQYATGSYAGINGWEINVYSDWDTDSIYCVRLLHEYATGFKQMQRYEELKEFVEKNYLVAGKITFNGEVSYGDDTETIYKIGEKGTIKVAYGNEDNILYVSLIFEDKENEKKYGFHQATKKYEMKNISSKIQYCLIETSENEIVYNVKNANRTYILLSRGNDVQQIKQLLNGNYTNQMKIYILANYIQVGIKRSEEEKAIPIIENECEKLCRQYIADVEKTRGETTQNFTPRDAILEYLRQKIFSPSERQTLDRVIPPDMMRGLIGGTINFMGSGKEGYYTDYEKYINPYAHD